MGVSVSKPTIERSRLDPRRSCADHCVQQTRMRWWKHALFLPLACALACAGCGRPYLRNQVEAFVAESATEETLFPWKQQSAVDGIVLFGKPVTPHLLGLLKEPPGDIGAWPGVDAVVQQNITMALCRIWHVEDRCGQTVYCNRAETRPVYDFWKGFPAQREVATGANTNTHSRAEAPAAGLLDRDFVPEQTTPPPGRGP